MKKNLHFKIAGWTFFSAFLLSAIFFNSAAQAFGILNALFFIYFFSTLIFLNIGIKTLREWTHLKSLNYAKCTARIYENSVPKIIFSGNISPLHGGEHVIGIFILCYVLTPFFFYWKIAFPDSAPRAPLALVAPILIHLQASTAFDLIILLAIRRNKICHSST